MTIDAGSGRPEVEAALVLLGKLGLSPDDLVAGAVAARPPVPTFAEFVPQVAAATSVGTLKAYSSYWNRVVEKWGTRRINEPTPLEIEQLGKDLRANRVIRRNGRDGSSAEENYVSAMRRLYRRAVANGFIAEADNPAMKVAKPRRQENNRRALPDARLAELNTAASTTGDDPALDSLLLRFHIETACRRGGALALRRVDLDSAQCLVRLREKGGTERWQPVSPTLMRYLLAHWEERGDGNPRSTGQLFRSSSGRGRRFGQPITYRRYDRLWERLGEHLPWVVTQGVSAHWLRHTVITWVERTFGYAVARAFAGHSLNSGDVGTTATYVKADLSEIATAVAEMTGEPHPLATPAS
ncbi:tyrosine-type recombinase/integrase [Actinoplanes sp. RD1]|uniref:tyrosine-type recombinase/integrase n=1 Tax=Actinoplanes sp. RD1 TaxID=3064538 RepID=UPI002741DFD9|nr:site-specific integrase [Actinoplanes sp. RD1]